MRTRIKITEKNNGDKDIASQALDVDYINVVGYSGWAIAWAVIAFLSISDNNHMSTMMAVITIIISLIPLMALCRELTNWRILGFHRDVEKAQAYINSEHQVIKEKKVHKNSLKVKSITYIKHP